MRKIEMKKITLLLALLLVVSQTTAVRSAQASVPSDQPGCVIPKLDLDKVPFPLKSANTKFELAEGEVYLLNGRVVKKDGAFFFQLDFDSQPWLATQSRIQNPFFAIDSADSTMIAKYGTGELVQMAVLVKKIPTLSFPSHNSSGSLGLQVIAPPMIAGAGN